MMRVTDMFLAFPFLVAIIVVQRVPRRLAWVTGIIGDKSARSGS